MRWLVFILFTFCGQQLAAQLIGFNRTYPDAEGYSAQKIDLVDDQYWVYCSNGETQGLLITNIHGQQISFTADISSDCPLMPSVSNKMAEFALNEQDIVVLSQFNDHEIHLQRFYQPECSSAVETLVSAIVPFDESQFIVATDIVSDKGANPHFYISAREYLGESLGNFPGPHTFRMWLIKLDKKGNELWRTASPFNVYSDDLKPALHIHQLSYEGGAMLIMQKQNDVIPHYMTTDKDGQMIYGGQLSTSKYAYFPQDQVLSLDGSRFGTEVVAIGGHSATWIHKYIAPEPASSYFKVSHGTDASGVHAFTQDNGLLIAGRSHWPSGEMWIKKYTNQGQIDFSISRATHSVIPDLIIEAENGEALMGGAHGGKLWLMKTCFPDIHPTSNQLFDMRFDSLWIPSSIIPMAGETIALLFNTSFSPIQGMTSGVDCLPMEIGFYLSDDTVLDDNDALFLEAIFPEVNPVYSVASGKLADDISPGQYYLIAHFDYLRKQWEPDEENNFYVLPFELFAEKPEVANPETFNIGLLNNSMADQQQLKADEFSVAIFPNPTTGQIVTTLNTNSPIIQYQLLDTYGKLLDQQELNHDPASGAIQLNLDLSDYGDGLYFLHFYMDGQRLSKKVIKN